MAKINIPTKDFGTFYSIELDNKEYNVKAISEGLSGFYRYDLEYYEPELMEIKTKIESFKDFALIVNEVINKNLDNLKNADLMEQAVINDYFKGQNMKGKLNEDSIIKYYVHKILKDEMLEYKKLFDNFVLELPKK